LIGNPNERHEPIQEDQGQTALEMEKKEDAPRKEKEAVFETAGPILKIRDFFIG
jgi:hypothetical protein